MKNLKRDKIILDSSLWILIINAVITYAVLFFSYINNGQVSEHTSFPWYTNVILVSTILSIPTIIFGFIYNYYYKRVYSKQPQRWYISSLLAFTLSLLLGTIDCFFGNIRFFIIEISLIAALIFFIINLVFRNSNNH